MQRNIQTKPRTYEDVMNAWNNYTHRWMDFVTHCPDLLTTTWFYEGGSISDQMAVEMRRLVSVWTMLYGADIVRIILSVMDYEFAKQCRAELFREGSDQPGDCCVTCMIFIMLCLTVHDKRYGTNRLDIFNQQMETQAIPAFEHAHNIFNHQ